jgi:hypothetical protein
MRVVLDSEYVRLTPECHEPPGAQCRVACATGQCGTYTYPEHEHGLKGLGYCNAVEWLTNGDPECQCSEAGDTEIPLHDGMEITVRWEPGDGYTWAPVEEGDTG